MKLKLVAKVDIGSAPHKASEAMSLGIDLAIDDLIQSCKNHDYTYAYSDDRNQWEKGREEAHRIAKLIKILVVDFKVDADALMNRCLEVAPKMRVKEGEVEGMAHQQIRAWFRGVYN